MLSTMLEGIHGQLLLCLRNELKYTDVTVLMPA